MIDSFKIHVSDYGEALLGMSNENLGMLTRSLIEYAMEENMTDISDPTVKALFNIMAKHIDRDEDYRKKKSEAGKKGGGQFGNSNAKKTSENEQKRTETSKNEQKQTPILSYPILSNNNNMSRPSGKRNQFVDDCPKSDIDFEEIERSKVKN